MCVFVVATKQLTNFLEGEKGVTHTNYPEEDKNESVSSKSLTERTPLALEKKQRKYYNQNLNSKN